MPKTNRNLCFLACLLACISSGFTANAQKKKKNIPVLAQSLTIPNARPQLIIGIVIDQMRYDYIYRYWDKFGKKGFRRLIEEGFSFENCNFNYVPTYTGPGHACIYTGTTPSINGIIANYWFVRSTNSDLYCAGDAQATTVGSTNATVGQMSPQNMLTTTIGDELRLATNFKGRVFGVALKDRGAILPAGHAANAAYWFDGASGNFVTSSYYGLPDLPQWLQKFNQQQKAQVLLSKKWETLLSASQYENYCAPDDNNFEGLYKGETRSTFPHDLPAILATMGNNYDLVRATPFGSTLTKDLAIALLEGEKLGKNNTTDMLAISFSSPDYVGHQFGPQSIEVMDTYLRLDQDIADLLTYIDKNYGKENVLVFITADHGAAQNPTYMKANKLPAGSFDKSCIANLKKHLIETYGDSLVQTYDNQQVYLNHNTIQAKKLNLAAVQQTVADFVLQCEGVAQTITATALQHADFVKPPYSLIENGFYPKRSGDVALNYEPGYMDWGTTGTTHGSPFTYDTHIPLIWYGYQVKTGKSSIEVFTIDIAPTIAQWLHIPYPSGCTGKPLLPYFH